MKTKILVTGASGFVGRSIVFYLATNCSFSIVANGRKDISFFDDLDNVVYIKQDFSLPFEENDFDICIHCAAKVDDMGNFGDFYSENVLKTKILINNLPTKIQFIYISTSSVYDFSDNLPKKENHECDLRCLSFYGKTKKQSEDFIIDSLSNYLILRPRAIYGKDDTTLLPRLKRLKKGKFLFIPNSKSVLTSLTNIELLCDFVYSSINNIQYKNEIFNICDDEIYSIHDIITTYVNIKNELLIPVRIPLWILEFIVKFNYLKIKLNISNQSLSPFYFNSILDTGKMKSIYKSNLPDFYNSKSLPLYINQSLLFKIFLLKIFSQWDFFKIFASW